MLMNENLQPNKPVLVDEKFWSQQPTSKIYNAKAIPESQIQGINRVVKLDIIVEGKAVKHFKHFQLKQSATVRKKEASEISFLQDAVRRFCWMRLLIFRVLAG